MNTMADNRESRLSDATASSQAQATNADRGRLIASAIALIASAALLTWAAMHSQI